MMLDERAFHGWRKSSRSGQTGGNCVEVGWAANTTGIRDTKQAGNPDRDMLAVSRTAWAKFVKAVRNDELSAC